MVFCKIPENVKFRIEAHLYIGASQQAISAVEGVSRHTVSRIKKNLKLFGTRAHPVSNTACRGRPQTIHPAACHGLRIFIEDKPWAYQEEMQYFLLDEFDIWMNQSTISRARKRMKINRKTLQNVAAERNQDLRDWYILQVGQYTPHQLVFLDESAASEKTCWRKRGWSLEGIRALAIRLIKRADRWSVLPAYCIEGILTYLIHQGSIDAERFAYFLRELVLPQCTPFPGPKSVIIMDNCSAHHSPEVKRLCEEAGVRLLYLPPYSPDYNPIEEFFSILKAWMKKNAELADKMPFEHFLHLAVDSCMGDQHSRNHFSHAGYKVDD